MDKKNKVRKSLKYSFIDGIFASSMLGLITDYITPYALALQATNRQIGFLSAAPSLASSLVQLKSADLTEKVRSRMKIITIFVFLHLLMLLPILLIPYLFKGAPVLFLVIFYTLFTSFGAFVGPAWSSLMSDYIPFKSRGKYFGWRSRIFGVITVLFAFLSGFILHIFRQNILKGFLVIFSLAFIFRFISWYFLARMYEPKFKVHKEAGFSFFDFIRRAKESNFAKFVLFVSCLNFCVNIAAPFFSVFMLRDLKFSYLTYTLLIITVTLAQIFAIGRWGKQADRIGNMKVIRFTSLIIATLPLWWLVNRAPFYLFFVQLLGGFAWSGFNLCVVNFIYDAVTPAKRTRCFAYFNVCNGLAVCLGALLGGHILNILPPFLGYKILSLFLIASIGRFIVVFYFSNKIKEVRSAEKISSMDLFYSIIGIRPALFYRQASAGKPEEEE